MVDKKRETPVEFLGQKIKCQSSCDFLVTLVFWRTSLQIMISVACFSVHRLMKMTEKRRESLSTNCYWPRSVKPAVRTCLMTLSIDKCGLLSISYDFSLFWNITSPQYCFFTFIILGSRYIVQVVHTFQIDLPKCQFTEPGWNWAFIFKSIGTTVTRCKKAMLSHFIK